MKPAESETSKSVEGSEKKISIGIIIFPFHKGSDQPLSNLIDLIHNLPVSIYLLTGSIESNLKIPVKQGDLTHIDVYHRGGSNPVTRVLRYVLTQLRLSFKLCISAKHINTWVFFLGGENLILPMLTAKLLRKRVILALGGSSAEIAKYCNDTYSKQMLQIFWINVGLANSILVYSKSLVKSWQLEAYSSKVVVAPRHFIESKIFKRTNNYTKRQQVVGYIGRLSEEKGVINFVTAIPSILKSRNDIKFFIGGDGPLREKIEEIIADNNLHESVEISGWIPHQQLGNCLNRLKLLVIPSYTEGLPNIMLEAMACGTPVLATPVGAIPDVISHRENGFIMISNSPQCITEALLSALDDEILDLVSDNGEHYVHDVFSYEKVADNYRSVLLTLLKQ
ncbi:MAG: glycosyltransferase family 4 protein [Candidatus Methanomethylophilaceae archaeon]|nr:glycosyltransferase family 4 protein [Candidatus Methanomethylophilaceae archaeon]